MPCRLQTAVPTVLFVVRMESHILTLASATKLDNQSNMVECAELKLQQITIMLDGQKSLLYHLPTLLHQQHHIYGDRKPWKVIISQVETKRTIRITKDKKLRFKLNNRGGRIIHFSSFKAEEMYNPLGNTIITSTLCLRERNYMLKLNL